MQLGFIHCLHMRFCALKLFNDSAGEMEGRMLVFPIFIYFLQIAFTVKISEARTKNKCTIIFAAFPNNIYSNINNIKAKIIITDIK